MKNDWCEVFDMLCRKREKDCDNCSMLKDFEAIQKDSSFRG